MNTITISELSKQFQVSTRMLRYYEKEGLISSMRLPEYSYRVYDTEAVKRLQQILVLRKLRIPVKQIALILEDVEQRQTLEIMQSNLAELEEEIEALSKIRDVLGILVSKLNESSQNKIQLDLLEEKELMEIVTVLKPSKTTLKEGYGMNDLTAANQVLENKMDIRIVYLPPAVVASTQYTGENPEDIAGKRLYSFIREKNLVNTKKDFRVFGFNNPSPQEGQENYGYEFWVTIPEEMQESEMPEKIVRKEFAGGLYAAHCIKFGDFHEWETFMKVMEKHEEYQIDWRAPEGMGGCMEEELNVYSNFIENLDKAKQLDLLIPIRKREEK